MKTIAGFAQPVGWGFRASFTLPEGITWERYRKNALLGLFHDTSALPIGRCTSLEVASDGRTADLTFEFGDQSDDRTAQAGASVRSGLLRICELLIDDDGAVLEASVVSLASDLSDRIDREDSRPRRIDRNGRLDSQVRMDTGFQVPNPSAPPSAPKPTTKSARERELDRFFAARQDGNTSTKEATDMDDPTNPMEATRQRNRELAQRQRVARETGASVAEQRHAEPLARQDANSTPRWQQKLLGGRCTAREGPPRAQASGLAHTHLGQGGAFGRTGSRDVHRGRDRSRRATRYL